MASTARIDFVDGAGRNDVHQFAKDDAILQSIFVRDAYFRTIRKQQQQEKKYTKNVNDEINLDDIDSRLANYLLINHNHFKKTKHQ